MRRLGLMLGLMLGVLCLSERHAGSQAQLVIDVITEIQTALTAVETTISAIEAVLHTAHWILEQTPIGGLALAEEFVEDMRTLARLVDEAEALGYSAGALSSMIQNLFALQGAPDTSTGLQERLWEVRTQVSTAYSYAARTQSLIMTARRTIRHVLNAYGQIMSALGNLDSQQQLSQQLTMLGQLETESKVTENAHRLASSLDRLTEPLILESLERINFNTMRTHP